MNRGFLKVWDKIMLNRSSIIGAGILSYFGYKLSKSMTELEENSAKHKIFDPVKAKAQIEVYKELYNVLEEEQEEEQRKLSLTKDLSETEKEKIQEYFKRDVDEKINTEISNDELQKELSSLKVEIDSLEEVNSSHQGFKFLKTVTSKDMFEDALLELREKQFDKKFRGDKEALIGDKPKVR